MHSCSRALRLVLLPPGLLLAWVAVGAPVLSDETVPPSSRLPESTTEFSRTAPVAVSPLPRDATTQAEVPRSETSPPARPSNPASTPASDSARSRRDEAARDAAVDNAGAKVAGPARAIDRERGIEIDPDAKEAAKTALQWAREVKHWVDPMNSGADTSTFQRPEPTVGSAYETRVGGAGPTRITPSNLGPGPDSPNSHSTAVEIDLIREAIKFIREVAWNPVTWLLMPFVALGSAALWVVQHRTQTERGLMRGRAVRGQRGSLDPGRRRLKRRSSRAADRPTSEHPAEGIPVRPRVRRSAKPQRLD